MNPNRRSLNSVKAAQDVKRAIALAGHGQQPAALTVSGAVRAEITRAAQARWAALTMHAAVMSTLKAEHRSKVEYDTEAAPLQGNHVSIDGYEGSIAQQAGIPRGEERLTVEDMNAIDNAWNASPHT